MTRRAALATAGAITIVLLAAAAAIATNLGCCGWPPTPGRPVA